MRTEPTAPASLRVVQHAYGGPEVLEHAVVDVPRPGAGEVLVRMAATSVNPIDVKTREGRGAAASLGAFPISVGWDVAGIVEAVGEGVASLVAGQRVFGMPRFPQQAASYAGHVVAPAEHLAALPEAVDAATAGALPLAGLTALSAVRDLAEARPGRRLLVRGAAGGVGHLAVQIAKILGAEVVAVDRAEKGEFVRGLGADEFRDDADGASVAPVDAVVDLVGGAALAASVSVTVPGGVVVCVPGGADAGLDELAARAGVRARRAAVRPDRDGLETLARWCADGALRVHLASRFALEDVVEAHRALARGGIRGKIGITVDAGIP
ncbi:NADP-dependent oxidoreductase [Nocardioides sp. L-11A]|uniref:NADP-dependent oxidoreductase n=1 Tax=Nocardioides sp. L-11A TaxID=3043848 RepID=UPI00249BF7A0|nr:NADP-dependent oxidoreductase [Nocardioides sp. L-11A]